MAQLQKQYGFILIGLLVVFDNVAGSRSLVAAGFLFLCVLDDLLVAAHCSAQRGLSLGEGGGLRGDRPGDDVVESGGDPLEPDGDG